MTNSHAGKTMNFLKAIIPSEHDHFQYACFKQANGSELGLLDSDCQNFFDRVLQLIGLDGLV